MDATQKAIVEALRAAGCTVVSLASVGAGCPDLLVGSGGVTYLLECKSPRAIRKDGTQNDRDRRSRERQEAWAARWRGGAVVRVETPLAALLACSLTSEAGRTA